MPEATADFGSLFEFLPIGAYRTGLDGVQLRANPALIRLNGLASEAEQLASAADGGRWYVQAGRREEFLALLHRDGQVVGFESEVTRACNGERIWIRENAHIVRDAQGLPLYYEGTIEEISNEVLARAVAEQRWHDLREITSQVPGVVYRMGYGPDGSRRVEFISDGVRALFGVEPDEVLRDATRLLHFIHPQDQERVLAELATTAASGGLLSTEYRVLLGGGQEKWVQQTSLTTPAGGPRRRVGVLVDVTARKQAEALRVERDRAEAARRAQAQFLSSVSHELRTPLNAILGFAQLLALDAEGERHQDWLQQVLDSGQHLLALVDDVLDLSAAQTGLLRVAVADVPLQPAVQEALVMVSGSAAQAGVELQSALPAALPWTVRADRKRLVQILVNLLSNGIKYNHHGGWVRVTAREDGGAIELAISDNGPGLDETQRERLFQPFERLGAQHGAVAGTGLGLSLSRQLAEAMGGQLEVESTPGAGATFRLRLTAA